MTNFRHIARPGQEKDHRAGPFLGIGGRRDHDLNDGQLFSGKHLIADEVATNLPVTAPRIDTAYFLIQGRDDVISPAKAAVAYFQKVKASQKTLVLIPDAGHFAFMTAPDAFLGRLRPKSGLPPLRAAPERSVTGLSPGD